MRGFCHNYLPPRGIGFTAYDPMTGAGIARLMDERVRLAWLESPGSITMDVQDFRAIAGGALVGCDSTWATPLLFKPLAHGADFAMEALTKYVGGHSDLLLGSVSVRDLALRQRLKDTMRMIGIGVSPDEAALALGRLETIGVRLAHMGRVALEFAGRLQAFPAAVRVLHPALPSCPGHEFWAGDFKGASGLFSVVLPPEAEALIGPALSAMRLFAMSVKADRTAVPWTEDGTILRVSVGLGDPEELWDDLATLPRGRNALWDEDGLRYAPPVR